MSIPPDPPSLPSTREELTLELVRRRLASLDARTVVHFGIKLQERFARLEDRLLGQLQEPAIDRLERSLKDTANLLRDHDDGVRRFLRGCRPGRPATTGKRHQFLALYARLSIQHLQLLEALAEYDRHVGESSGELRRGFEEAQELLRVLGWHIQAGEERLAGPDRPDPSSRPAPGRRLLAPEGVAPAETRDLYRHNLGARLRDLALTRAIVRQTALQLGILENQALAVRTRLQATAAETVPLLRQLVLAGLSFLETELACSNAFPEMPAAVRPLFATKARLLREETASLDQLDTLKSTNAQLISLIAKLIPPDEAP